MGLTSLIKNWQAEQTAKRKTQKERLAHIEPLRAELVGRLLKVCAIALPIEAALVVWAAWPLEAPLSGLAALGTVWPALCLMLAFCSLRWGKPSWRVQFAIAMLFQSVVFAVSFSEAVLIKRAGHGYPQYGGVLILTILLSGLLIGEFYVGAWTLICCVSLQYAIHNSDGWIVNAGWAATYIAAGWLVAQFSRHLERLFEAGRTAEEQQRSAIVAERTRFARDIHDTLAQGFTGIMMQLNAAEQRLLPSESGQARAHIEKARQLASASLEEARRSVSALRSATLANGSLLAAIEQIGHQLTADSAVRLETKLEGQPYALPDQCEANLLRIAQEALTNSVRHARASMIHVLLGYRTGSVVLEVGDSGHGMTGSESSGFGIEGMRQRAREIGGEIKILSDPGRGTRVIVTVPNA